MPPFLLFYEGKVPAFLRYDSTAKTLLLHKGCINIQSERWRSMDAKPGEGEQAKGGERQDVARALHPWTGD
jgi:hypothetical protein